MCGYTVSIPVTWWVSEMWVMRMQYIIPNFHFSMSIHDILFGAKIVVWWCWNNEIVELWLIYYIVLNARTVVGMRVTGIRHVADTRRIRVWVQIHTHERIWVWDWFEPCLTGMDSWTIYPCPTRPIAILTSISRNLRSLL